MHFSNFPFRAYLYILQKRVKQYLEHKNKDVPLIWKETSLWKDLIVNLVLTLNNTFRTVAMWIIQTCTFSYKISFTKCVKAYPSKHHSSLQSKRAQSSLYIWVNSLSWLWVWHKPSCQLQKRHKWNSTVTFHMLRLTSICNVTLCLWQPLCVSKAFLDAEMTGTQTVFKV